MPDEATSKHNVTLPNLSEKFHGFNLDKWADTAHAVINYNVLESVEKYSLAVDFFENNLIIYIEREDVNDPKSYAYRLKEFMDKEVNPKYKTWDTSPMVYREKLKVVADFKVRELTKLVDRFRKKYKSYVISPVHAIEEMKKRAEAKAAEKKKLEVVEDGVDSELKGETEPQ